MKRYFLILLFILMPLALLAARPRPCPRGARSECVYRVIFTVTPTATVIATENETSKNPVNAYSEIHVSTPSPTPRIAGAQMCLWFTYEKGCSVWATVTPSPVFTVFPQPIPPTAYRPPVNYP